MIHSILIINNSGQPRLAKFYTPLSNQSQQLLIKQLYASIISRSPDQSNILPLPDVLKSSNEGQDDLKVIYRLYATLNFVFIFDSQESELGILDMIQVFVEALDKCFSNVCELDLVYGWETVETVLEDLIQGGIVLETNAQKVIDAVDSANGQTSSGNTKPQSRAAKSTEGVSYSRWGPVRIDMGTDTAAVASKAWTDMTSTLRSYLPGR